MYWNAFSQCVWHGSNNGIHGEKWKKSNTMGFVGFWIYRAKRRCDFYGELFRHWREFFHRFRRENGSWQSFRGIGKANSQVLAALRTMPTPRRILVTYNYILVYLPTQSSPVQSSPVVSFTQLLDSAMALSLSLSLVRLSRRAKDGPGVPDHLLSGLQWCCCFHLNKQC